jgi:hypothetical protein
MSTDEYITLLACLGDIQAAVDATALDVERLLDANGIREDDDLQPPEWVNGD